MLYNQPYGVSDPNAAYINGNPATGTAGSIPPAASIEYPQREIVALINDSGITPNNSDLTQLAQSVQGGKVNYQTDAGTGNAFQVTLLPAPTAYRAGLVVRMKVVRAPTGPSTLNCNALGPLPIKKRNGKDTQAGDFWPNDIIELVCDGSMFFLIGSEAVSTLAASLDYYVATTGSDTANNGLSAASPFATIQHALAVTQSFNLNGYTVTIHVANGGYSGPIVCPLMNGSGTVVLIGNTSTPSSVTVTSTHGSVFIVLGPGYTIQGFKVVCSGAAPENADAGNGVIANVAGTVNLYDMEYGSCPGAHVASTNGGYVAVMSREIISGGAQQHYWCQVGASLQMNPTTPPPITITTPVTFTTYCLCLYLGQWVNPMGAVTGAGNVTGQRFNVAMNGIINCGGGLNHFPGTTAGVTSTGGQYG